MTPTSPVPYDGGMISGGAGMVISANASISFWVDYNGSACEYIWNFFKRFER